MVPVFPDVIEKKDNKPYMKEIIESCCNFDLLREKMQKYKEIKQLEKEALEQASATKE